MTQARASLRVGLHLGAAVLLGLSLLSLIHAGVASRISEREARALKQHIDALLPPTSHDNDPLAEVTVPAAGPKTALSPVRVYPARQGTRPVALVAEVMAPGGYNGTIHLLVVIQADGSLLGVRVLSHRETPGLGDAIEAGKSGWIDRFAGLSLANPPPSRWAVRRDGGDFDQFAGATITPRAVVRAVKKTLVWFAANRDNFIAPADGA